MTSAVPVSRRKLVLGFLWIPVLVLVVSVSSIDSDTGFDRFEGYLAAAAGISLLAHFAPQLFGRPLLRLDGVDLEFGVGWKRTRIPWTEIDYLGLSTRQVVFRRLAFLDVAVRDPASEALTLTRAQRRALRKRGSLPIVLMYASMNGDEILALIEAHARSAGFPFDRSDDGQALIRA